MAAVIETQTVFTPLGIRFWDPVLDVQIQDGLTVRAWPQANTRQKVNAYQTRSGVYTFSHLPGMRDIEYGLQSSVPDSPAEQHNFIVQVHDNRGRYVDAAFSVDLPLPYNGVYLSNGGGSPADTPQGFYLFSSITRPIPPWMGAVQGELVDQSTGEPAAHAMLSIYNEDGDVWHGITDASGHFCVMMPYPDPAEGYGGSPLDPGQIPLHEQFWLLDLEVSYSPGSRESLSGTDIPAYLSILSQTGAQIWPQAPEDGGSSVSQLSLSLQFHQVTVTKTDGRSQLLVSP